MKRCGPFELWGLYQQEHVTQSVWAARHARTPPVIGGPAMHAPLAVLLWREPHLITYTICIHILFLHYHYPHQSYSSNATLNPIVLFTAPQMIYIYTHIQCLYTYNMLMFLWLYLLGCGSRCLECTSATTCTTCQAGYTWTGSACTCNYYPIHTPI